MADGECGAFLVWGDPTLYDSTIRIIEIIANSGRHQLDYEVIPGISSIQALAAKHKTTLNRIGQSIEITTGRKMAEGFPADADSVVVMLDADEHLQAVRGSGYRYLLGCLCRHAGRNPGVRQARDVVHDIERIGPDARRANGWIMDSYLMRRGGVPRPERRFWACFQRFAPAID